MTRNITLLIALTWFLVVASFIMCTNATGRAHSQTIDDTVVAVAGLFGNL
ncbi:hypothetical protein ACOSQ4_016026 [Xanthoceras sorbifolium]